MMYFTPEKLERAPWPPGENDGDEHDVCNR